MRLYFAAKNQSFITSASVVLFLRYSILLQTDNLFQNWPGCKLCFSLSRHKSQTCARGWCLFNLYCVSDFHSFILMYQPVFGDTEGIYKSCAFLANAGMRSLCFMS